MPQLCSLLAYDAAGNVVATLDYAVARDDHGDAVGLLDFAAHEAAGGALTDIWQVADAKGSGTWPEWLGGRAHDFRVERRAGRIAALVHRTSGHRRDRAAIEAAIAAVQPDATGAKDIRHIVGGPVRPLQLDAAGRDAARSGTPPHLPVRGIKR